MPLHSWELAACAARISVALRDNFTHLADRFTVMLETRSASIYDYPRYYDLLFGSDWKAEFDFLRKCFDRYALRKVKRLYEPACGTGRLLIKFAQAGYTVAGGDLNPRAVEFCNKRLSRYGFTESVRVEDMADFAVKRPYDAAFNTINTFRHLPSEAMAVAHLKCMAQAIGVGGIYLLGLHLTPAGKPTCSQETWSARRGNLVVNSWMKSLEIDRRKRRERVAMRFDVYTLTDQFRLEDELLFRTYSRRQIRQLLAAVPEWECAATHDFAYDVDAPIEVDDTTEDVVFVLRRT